MITFHADDTVLMGSETSGVPPEVHAAAEARLRIPLISQARSINMVNAAAMALGEGLRQTRAGSFNAQSPTSPA